MNLRVLLTKPRESNLARYIGDILSNAGCDVTYLKPNIDIREIDEHVVDMFGGDYDDFDVLINAAGVTDMHHVENWDYEKAHEIISVNLTGAIALNNAFVRAAQARGDDKQRWIIHIGSLYSRKCATGGAAYCASKAGLAHFIECAGYELGKRDNHPFSVIGIHPGNIIGTGMTEEIQERLADWRGYSSELIDEIYEDAVKPTKIAEMIQGILSHYDPEFINGENIYLGQGDKR
jgi:NAD(P)-dependent dehydrogenase (short-subunit alcohol dehydrogenase family)